MKIIRASGPKNNWVAGASGVYFYLNQEIELLAFYSDLGKLTSNFKRDKLFDI